MDQKLLNFQSQNLVVDWVSFKFQYLSSSRLIDIANYLFKHGFNSYKQSAKLSKPNKEYINENPKNTFEVLFVTDTPHWKGTTLQFSGLNAQKFYTLMKDKLVSWELFSDATLGRFDVYYCRENKNQDLISSSDFLNNLYIKLKQTTKTIKLEKNSKSIILKIGNRKSNHYSRIYQRKNLLRFELEMKGKILQNYNRLLIQNYFEEFEESMSNHFILYFGNILPLESSYLDWLVIQLRPIRQQKIPSLSLNSDYIRSEIKSDPLKLIRLLQFINYAQQLDFETEYLGEIRYRVVTFRLQNFLKFQQKSNNQYQLTQTKLFFDEIQTGILLRSFSDKYFQSLVAVPLVKFEKAQKFLIAKVWLVDDLFYYSYPFLLPDFFRTKLTKHQFDVRFTVFQAFNSVNIEKRIFIKQFINSYPSSLNNSQKTNIKKFFLELVMILKESDLIQSNYKILSNGKFQDVDELTLKNISEGFIIYEKLSI